MMNSTTSFKFSDGSSVEVYSRNVLDAVVSHLEWVIERNAYGAHHEAILYSMITGTKYDTYK